MKKLIFHLMIAVLILSACKPENLSTPTLPASGSPSPEVTEPISGAPTVDPTLAALQLAVHPPEERTGLVEVDQVIEALMAHDFPTLKDLTGYLEIGCANVDGLGGPPKCREDEDEGTVVEVVPFLGPEGYHQRRDDYENWPGPDIVGLLAVYRTSPSTWSDPAYPAGEFGLVFLLSSGQEVLTVQVNNGKIVRYDYSFGGITPADLENHAEEIIIPLNFQAIPTPVPWNKFTDPQGRYSFIYPPLLELTQEESRESWILGERIRVEVLPSDTSWITCFNQELGDCPLVENDEMITVNGVEVRRVSGNTGSGGGNIPQEFLCYIFSLGDQALVMTVYALSFDSQVSDVSRIWPLEGMAPELFQRTVETVQLYR